MKKSATILRPIVMLFLLLGLSAPQATAATINVSPGAGTPLQNAINAANAGDIISVAAGTYTEDLAIPATKTNLELVGAGAATTTIKGVAMSHSTGTVQPVWPAGTPNIEVLASGVRIHGFTIESPNAVLDFASLGMIIGGDNVEVYGNVFKTASAANLNDISQAIVSYRDAINPTGGSVNGLNIHNNTFESFGSATAGYEAIFINHTLLDPNLAGLGSVTIANNTFSWVAGKAKLFRGITTERSKVNITGNTLVTELAAASTFQGINVRDYDGRAQQDVTISGNIVSGFNQNIFVGTAVTGTILNNNIVTDSNLVTGTGLVYGGNNDVVSAPFVAGKVVAILSPTTALTSGKTITLTFPADTTLNTANIAATDFVIAQLGGAVVAPSAVAADNTAKTVTLTVAAGSLSSTGLGRLSIALSSTAGGNEIIEPPGATTTGVFAFATNTSPADTGSINNVTIVAGALVNVAWDAGDAKPAGTANQIITFDTSHILPANGKIAITYPAGFTVASAAFVSAVGIDGTFAVGVSDQTVTLTRSGGTDTAVGAGKSVTISGIINRSEVASFTVLVATRTSAGADIDKGSATRSIGIALTEVQDDVSNTQNRVSATGTHLIKFKTTSALAGWSGVGTTGGRVFVTFPDAFNVTGAGIGTGSAGFDGLFSVDVSGQTVILTRTGSTLAIAANTSVTFAIGGIVNASAIGSYSVKVGTKGVTGNAYIDGPTQSATFNLGTQMQSITVTPSDITVNAAGITHAIALALSGGEIFATDCRIAITYPNGFDVTGALVSNQGVFDGNLVLTRSGQTLTLTRSGGSATPSSVTLTLGGIINPTTSSINYTVIANLQSASGQVLQGPTTSSPFTIAPGAATKLAFVQQPTTVSTLTAIFPAVTVQLKDQYNNNVPTPGVPITVAMTSGVGTLSGTKVISTTATPPGLATFGDLMVDTEGDKQLTATSPNLASAVSSTFTVNAQPVTKLAILSINAGNQVVAGTPFDVVVVSRSDNGAVARVTANTTVTLSVLQGTPAKLGGTLTGVMAAGTSTITFSGINYIKAETGANKLQLRAAVTAGPGLISGDSAQINVVPNVPNKLAITSVNNNAVVKVNTAFSVNVQSQDAYGNPVAVAANTGVQLVVKTGTGAITGGVGQINAGGTELALGAVTYSVAQGGVVLSATRVIGDNLLPGDSSPFAVTADATQLSIAVSPISPATVFKLGVAFRIVVTARDANGNVANVSANKAITIAKVSASSDGTLTAGTGTILNGNSSVTIDTTSFSKADSALVLSASASGLGTVNSSAILVAGDPNSFVVTTITPSSPVAGSAFSVKVEMRDSSGNSTYGDATASLELRAGDGVLGGTTTGAFTTTAANTSKTIEGVTYTKAQTGVKVRANGLTGKPDSSPFTVTAGAVNKLAITVINSGAIVSAGTGFTVTVQVWDANNNVSTAAANVPVTLTKAAAGTGGGTLGGTMTGTIAAGSQSVIISGVTLSAAGQGLVLTASAENITAANSSTFNVAGNATALVVASVAPISPATSIVAGQPFAVTVKAVDAVGSDALVAANRVVELSKNAGAAGTLGGILTATIQAGQNNTTLNPTYTKAGAPSDLILTATDKTATGPLTAAQSGAISVVAGPVTKLSISPPPAGILTATSFNLQVNTQDQFGNLANVTASTVIGLSVKPGTGTGVLGGTTSDLLSTGNSITFSVTYSKAETAVVVTATTLAGPSLTAADSAPFGVAGTAAKLAFKADSINNGQIVTVAPDTFTVKVYAQDVNGVDAKVQADTTFTLSVKTGTGTLGGTVTGTILAGQFSATITSSYSLVQSGVALTATRTAGDTISAGDSGTFAVAGAASELAITSINGGDAVLAGTAFKVKVQLQDTNHNPTKATSPVTVTITKKAPTGEGAGTLNVPGGPFIIGAGSSWVEVTGMTQNQTESGVVLTADDGGPLTAGDSSAFTIQPAPPNRYVVTVTGPLYAGVAVTVTAQLKDASNNNTPLSGHVVTWTKTGTLGFFSASTSTTDANGAATVSFTPSTTSGRIYTISATGNETPTALTTPVPAVFTTIPGPLNAFQIEANPTTFEIGSPNQLIIYAVDKFGNGTNLTGDATLVFGGLGTSASGAVPTVSDKTGSAKNLGTATTIPFENGVNTAAGVLIATKAEGPVTLTAFLSGAAAISTGSSGGRGAVVTVTAGAAASYSVTSSSTSTTAGSTVTITAQAIDANGNATPASGSVVTWSSTGTGGSFASPTSTTGANGAATVVFTTSTTPGTVHTVTATTGSLTGTSAAITTDADVDSDGDGYTNAQEIIAGTDPNNPASALRITAVRVVGSNVEVDFDAIAGKLYKVENKDALSDATWTQIDSFTGAITGTQTVSDTGAGTTASQFYRIKAGPNGEVVSDPAGFYGVTLTAGPNAISVPLHNLGGRRLVSSVSGSTVTVSGSPGWTANAFGPQSGFSQYVVLVRKDASASPGIEGDWWTVASNTANTLTVNAGADALSSLLGSGDQIEVRRLTSMKDLFGTGTTLILNKDADGNAASGSSASADVIRYVSGTSFGAPIFYHDGSILAAGYYAEGGSVGPLDGSTITVLPGQGFMVFRKTGSSATTVRVAGQVQVTRLTEYLKVGPNVIGSPFAKAAPIGTSNLKESGWVSDSDGSAASGDSSKASLLRLITGTSFGSSVFHHDGSILSPAGWYDANGVLSNDFPLQAGKAYIFYITPGSAVRWRQAVP